MVLPNEDGVHERFINSPLEGAQGTDSKLGRQLPKILANAEKNPSAFVWSWVERKLHLSVITLGTAATRMTAKLSSIERKKREVSMSGNEKDSEIFTDTIWVALRVTRKYAVYTLSTVTPETPEQPLPAMQARISTAEPSWELPSIPRLVKVIGGVKYLARAISNENIAIAGGKTVRKGIIHKIENDRRKLKASARVSEDGLGKDYGGH